MICDPKINIVDIIHSHNYSKGEINFILNRNNLGNINEFYINGNNIVFSKDNNLFCDTLITFDDDNTMYINYNYSSLRTMISKITTYSKNKFNFLDEMIDNETVIKKDYTSYQSYSHSITQTSFMNNEIIYKYHNNEMVYNSNTIGEFLKNHKDLTPLSYNNSSIKPDIKYIYDAQRQVNNLNLVKWIYIDNNNSLKGTNICNLDNSLQNLMNIPINDKIENSSIKSLVKKKNN